MIKRDAEAKLLNQAGKFPAVSVTGPRQSGKTTLVRQAFPDHEYVTFENPDNRSFFESDPRSFLSLHKSNVIFDEAQRVPDLFSYLQEIIDDSNEPGRFVLTGSQNFLLLKAVSQSLAGRVALFTLLPLSYHELASAGLEPKRAADWVFNGGYPRVFSSGIDPQSFFPSYIDTYLQRDVREELGVRSLSAFGKFLQLCALSCGNLLNVTSLARDCGVDTKTARDWLSILEASHIVYLLEPYFSNARKRLIKTPKLYFLDTGLTCNLIGIDSPEKLMTSPTRSIGPPWPTRRSRPSMRKAGRRSSRSGATAIRTRSTSSSSAVSGPWRAWRSNPLPRTSRSTSTRWPAYQSATSVWTPLLAPWSTAGMKTPRRSAAGSCRFGRHGGSSPAAHWSTARSRPQGGEGGLAVSTKAASEMHSPRRGKPAPLRLEPIRDARDRDRTQQREGERQYECR